MASINAIQETRTGEDTKPPWPYPNMTVYRLMKWMITGHNRKSEKEIMRLAREVINAPDFKADDLKGFDAHRANRILDQSENRDPATGDGWKECNINICVPTRVMNPKGNGKIFAIPHFRYRPLVSVIKSAFSDVSAKSFHLFPFKRIWQPPFSGSKQRVHDELYTSDSWIQAQEALNKQPPEPGCKLERVIAALMFWSDATRLTSFGSVGAWPVYMYFGNLSKYVRAKPTSGACHHVAYIPSLPDNIQEFIASFITQARRPAALLAHCRRELMHEVWRILLDEEFLHAYKHGIVIRCFDGIIRRVFPRFFTYSADYPEKTLLATIRDMGECGCPRCLTPKTSFDQVGFSWDSQGRLEGIRRYMAGKILLARDFLYKQGTPIKARAVETMLKPESLVPTINAFSERLGPLGFDVHSMLVVDMMHEFELGVWESVFTHLIRLLTAVGHTMVAELDSRFRQMPTFGQGAIRGFSSNVSEMKNLAARNFEDILQCSMPAFKHLLPEPHDELVQTLLFRLAEWHALAKLRLHTDETLVYLQHALKVISRLLRHFRDVTSNAFKTTELPRETSARMRRKQAKSSKGHSSSTKKTKQGRANKGRSRAEENDHEKVEGDEESSSSEKKMSLHTYKFHSLGDYARAIRLFGTTDSYSTQIGELAHRLVKKLYDRTNKTQLLKSLSVQERRYNRMSRNEEPVTDTSMSQQDDSDSDLDESDERNSLPIELHHYISASQRNSQDLHGFLRNFAEDDPAIMDHLLGRLLNFRYDGDEFKFSPEQRNNLRILDNRIYSVKTMRVHYTTYDVRRDYDTINISNNSDVMVLSREKDQYAHPYWYARVLGVFHARVLHTGPEAANRSVQNVEFLFVRWFGGVPNHRSGFKVARLPKIGFVRQNDRRVAPFGFLNPSVVVRACHLIPAFVDGRTSSLLREGPSAGRVHGEVDDWTAYYVNIFSDRDMFMRYRGNGVGHMGNFVKHHPSGAYGPQEELPDVHENDEEERIYHDQNYYRETIEEGTDKDGGGQNGDDNEDEDDDEDNEDGDGDENEEDDVGFDDL
ncbi:hypothetical protein SERLA73DRAFT_63876 [Serpula lacrymans var. lacrymans S7.3]|uniref:Uncharacterized protein n=2 Tax=Serpula lacrymans var. lacrymans TaxID=341189 RepID=F8QDE2_SERL3|nr:hypothetical protein SERLA73DRAFT_63876 [Serpula lacrymans var. lacrymans S7.3]